MTAQRTPFSSSKDFDFIQIFYPKQSYSGNDDYDSGEKGIAEKKTHQHQKTSEILFRSSTLSTAAAQIVMKVALNKMQPKQKLTNHHRKCRDFVQISHL